MSKMLSWRFGDINLPDWKVYIPEAKLATVKY